MPSRAALICAQLMAVCVNPAFAQDFDAAAWRHHILPSDIEAAWLKIEWRRDLALAVFEAEEQEKPLLIWSVEGDPFGCNCEGRAERRFVWALPALRDLSEMYVPVCAGAEDLLAESGFFRRLVERSGLAGDVPGRGVFACTPDGTPLGAIDSISSTEVQAMLERGVLDWHDTPDSRRMAALGPRPEQPDYPDGVAMMVTSRDLPPELDPLAPCSPRWNRDHVWFIGKEARAFLPKKLELGKARKVPGPLTRRLARFNLLDNVLGPSLPFEATEVAAAELVSEITGIEGDRVLLSLRGSTRARAQGEWPRALECELRGSAVWDCSASRFESFELIGLGTRRGRSPENGRSRSQEPTPIGFVIQLAGAPSMLNEPTFAGRYLAQ